MADNPRTKPMFCAEKAGFLFSHRCESEPDSKCDSCRRWVCAAHVHVADANNRLCTRCARARIRRGGRVGQRGNPRLFSSYHYSRYNHFSSGWGSRYLHVHAHHAHHGQGDDAGWDATDLSEADGAAFAADGDEAWESDLGDS